MARFFRRRDELFYTPKDSPWHYPMTLDCSDTLGLSLATKIHQRQYSKLVSRPFEDEEDRARNASASIWTRGLSCLGSGRREIHEPKPKPKPSAATAPPACNHPDKSRFYSLPTEMLLEVARYACPVSRLVLQRVCRRFRAVLAPDGRAPEIVRPHPVLHEYELLQLTFLLRRDAELMALSAYERECELASPDSQLRRLGCSGCRTTHAKQFFSGRQLSLSPETRICKGLEGSLRFCPDQTFSGLCLLKGLRELPDAVVHCKSNTFCDSADVTGGAIKTFCIPKIGFQQGHTITVDRLVPVLAVQTSWSRKAIPLADFGLRTALRVKPVFICPHLRSDSAAFFGDRKLTAECPEQRTTRYRGEVRRTGSPPCRGRQPCRDLRRGRCVEWAACREKGCNTRYSLRRIGSFVGLEISCDLVGGPTDPSWLAQMQYGDDGDDGDDEKKDSGFDNKKEAGCGREDRCKGTCFLRRYQVFPEGPTSYDDGGWKHGDISLVLDLPLRRCVSDSQPLWNRNEPSQRFSRYNMV